MARAAGTTKIRLVDGETVRDRHFIDFFQMPKTAADAMPGWLTRAIAQVETGGEADPWIRTKVAPKGGSAAYGPYQLTPTMVGDYKRRFPDIFKGQENYVNKFLDQGKKFLMYGKEPNKPGYDVRYDYGGAGDLSGDEWKGHYHNMARAIMNKVWQESGGDVRKFAHRWRGDKNPAVNEAYYNKLNKFAPPPPAKTVAPPQPAPAGMAHTSAESALGIPSRADQGDPTKLPVGSLVDWTASQHLARRAGKHVDIRLGTPETGLLSWALRKGLPGPSERVLAARQPVHEHSYLTFKGEIPAGQYGAGAVEPLDVGKALITKATPTQVNLILAHKRRPEEYTLVKTKKDWLMVNTTPDDAELLERYPKERYKSADPAMFKQLVKDRITSAKIDGANILAVLKRNKMRVFSSRISQTGKPIEHTHRIGGLTGLTVPPELRGIVLRGELYGEKAGKAIPPQQLSALLNSTLQNALERKAKDDIKLRLALFDVAGKEPLK